MKDAHEPVIVSLSRNTILEGNISKVVSLLESFLPGKAEEYGSRVRFQVDGYGDDPRELYDIEEVRDFFQRLFDEYEGLFYWIDPSGDMLMFIGLMLYEPLRAGEEVGLAPEDQEEFLRRGLADLRSYCLERGLTIKTAEREISRYIKMKIGS